MIFWSLLSTRASLNFVSKPIQLFQNIYHKWLPQVRNGNSKRQKKDNRYDDNEHSFFKLCLAETEKLSYRLSMQQGRLNNTSFWQLGSDEKAQDSDKSKNSEEEEAERKKQQEAEKTKKQSSNQLITDQKTVILQHAANSPCEDRATAVCLNSIQGKVICVFDGHGGAKLAELAQKKLPEFIDKQLEQQKQEEFEQEDDYIISALTSAFDQFEAHCLRLEQRHRDVQDLLLSSSHSCEVTGGESDEDHIITGRNSDSTHLRGRGSPSLCKDRQKSHQKPSMIGTCALVALIYNNKLYAANLGDSKGVIISVDRQFQEEEEESKDNQKSCTTDPNKKQSNQNNNNNKGRSATVKLCRKINHKLNANSKKEQARLKSAYPEDVDILVEKQKNMQKQVYVKNILQPTRSFGDFYLKIEEYWDEMVQMRGYCHYAHSQLLQQKQKQQQINQAANTTTNTDKNQDTSNSQTQKRRNNNNIESQQKQMEFRGPYITHKPDIKIFNLDEKQDAYLVMGSDGLWDELNKSQVAKIICENIEESDEEIVKQILYRALENVAEKAKITMQDVMFNIPEGERRSLHDDITIILTNLNGCNNNIIENSNNLQKLQLARQSSHEQEK